MDIELRLRAALGLEDTSDDFIARVMARVGTPQVIDIRSRRRSRLIVLGALAVVGIAAAMFIWRVSEPEPGPVDALLPPDDLAYDEKAAPALKRATSGEVPETTLSAAEPEAGQVAPALMPLPLVPAPAGPRPDPDKSLLVLRKAVERHPELVQGPELDDTSVFLVSMAMRKDGAVINSVAELTSPDTIAEISRRVLQSQPTNLPMGEIFNTGFGKGYPFPDGSESRARVSLSAVFLTDSFDVTRSDARVREIIGQKYDELMTLISSDEFDLLTVFLSDDGRILRERVERVTMQNADLVTGLGTGARQEETIAASLGISVEEIGQIGATTLGRGSSRKVVDEHGAERVEGFRELAVRYAWALRMDEVAAVHTPRRTSEPVADFDLTAALVVAEQLLPDAFSHAPLSFSEFMASRPTVVFTAKGEVIRAGRVQLRTGVNIDSLLQEQLVPGVSTMLHRSVRLTNKDGAKAMVDFAWER